MKLQVIVAAIAMVLGTAAYADMTSVTTTTVNTTSHHAKSGMRHSHHGKYHRHHRHHGHHQMNMHHGKTMVKKVVVHEEMSPPGSVTVIK